MKNKSTKQHPASKTIPVAKKKSPLWMVVVVIVIASVGGVLWGTYNSGKGKNSPASSSPSHTPTKSDKDLLVARWVRVDSEGNYIIEIKSATADGKLDARYFNPNPIKVGRAEWQQKNGSLMIVVELRDVNYPGSTYTLNFIPSENRLTGNYYQAVEGANFDVEFVRSR